MWDEVTFVASRNGIKYPTYGRFLEQLCMQHGISRRAKYSVSDSNLKKGTCQHLMAGVMHRAMDLLQKMKPSPACGVLRHRGPRAAAASPEVRGSPQLAALPHAC